MYIVVLETRVRCATLCNVYFLKLSQTAVKGYSAPQGGELLCNLRFKPWDLSSKSVLDSSKTHFMWWNLLFKCCDTPIYKAGRSWRAWAIIYAPMPFVTSLMIHLSDSGDRTDVSPVTFQSSGLSHLATLLFLFTHKTLIKVGGEANGFRIGGL